MTLLPLSPSPQMRMSERGRKRGKRGRRGNEAQAQKTTLMNQDHDLAPGQGIVARRRKRRSTSTSRAPRSQRRNLERAGTSQIVRILLLLGLKERKEMIR